MKVSKLIQELYVEELFGLFDEKDVEYNKKLPNNISDVERSYKIKFPISFLETEKDKATNKQLAVLFFNPKELKPKYSDITIGNNIGSKRISSKNIIVFAYENAVLTMSGKFYFGFDAKDIKLRVDDAPVIIFDSNLGDAVKTNIVFREFYKIFKDMPWSYFSKKYINEVLKIAPQFKHNILDKDDF